MYMKKIQLLVCCFVVLFFCACGQPEHIDTVFIISANSEWKAFTTAFSGCAASKVSLRRILFYGSKKRAVHRCFFFTGDGEKFLPQDLHSMLLTAGNPKLIVNLATCGGFGANIKKGDIINVTKTITYDIIEAMGDSSEAIQFYSSDVDYTLLPKVLQPQVVNDLIVSADRDIVPAEIERLKKMYNARVGDWESSSIAFVAKKNNTRLIILRGVSDVVSIKGDETYGNNAAWESGADMVMKKFVLMINEF